MYPLVMLAVGVTPVANHLKPTDHLADGEEAERLGGDNTDGRQGGGVHIPYAGKQALWAVHCLLGGALGRGAGSAHQTRGVTERVLQRREVGLNGLHCAVWVS